METTEAPPAAPETEAPKKLRRSRGDRWIAGVCGGLADYFGVNAAVYRVLFVALAFAGGTGILLYVAAALVMPAEDTEESVLAEVLRRHRERPWLVIAMALLALFLAFAVTGPFDEGHGVFWPGAVVFWLFVSLVLVVVVWAARGGGRRILMVLATLVALLAIAVAGAIAVAVSIGVTDVTERPADVSELEAEYRIGGGALVLDLRDLELPEGEQRVEARVGFGELEVIVPDDIPVRATARAGWGDVSVLGVGGEGRDVRQRSVDPGFEDAGTRLVIDARVRAGEVSIHR